MYLPLAKNNRKLSTTFYLYILFYLQIGYEFNFKWKEKKELKSNFRRFRKKETTKKSNNTNLTPNI